MKITLTNGQMYDSLGVLAAAEETGKLGYAIARNRRKIQTELTEYMDVREELLKKYGTDKGNGEYSFTPEAIEQFNKEIQEYAGITAEIDLMMVPQEIFTSGGLTSKQMYTLDWMEADSEETDTMV